MSDNTEETSAILFQTRAYTFVLIGLQGKAFCTHLTSQFLVTGVNCMNYEFVFLRVENFSAELVKLLNFYSLSDTQMLGDDSSGTRFT